MQTQDTQKANVISLFNARQEKASESSAEGCANASSQQSEESFADVMARNNKNAERLAKERASANKSVLRSYRIKN